MDSETLDLNKKPIKNIEQKNGDFPSMGVDLLKKTNFKIAIFLFMIGMFIFSDIFIEKILPKEHRDGNCATTSGTVIQLVALIICYLIIDLLVAGGIL